MNCHHGLIAMKIISSAFCGAYMKRRDICQSIFQPARIILHSQIQTHSSWESLKMLYDGLNFTPKCVIMQYELGEKQKFRNCRNSSRFANIDCRIG
jgi:hypothetical protein